MNELRRDEQKLVGRWTFQAGRVVADAVSERIDTLITRLLMKVAVSQDGWTTLYVDPRDSRLWELSYPESDMHGGGPPTLTHVTLADAQQRYHYPQRASGVS